MVFLQHISHPVFNQRVHLAVVNETLVLRIETTDAFIVSQPNQPFTVAKDIVHPVVGQFITGQVARLVFGRFVMFQRLRHQVILIETGAEGCDIEVLMAVFRYGEYLFVVDGQRIFTLSRPAVQLCQPPCVRAQPEVSICIFIHTHNGVGNRTRTATRLIMPQPFPFGTQFVYAFIVGPHPQVMIAILVDRHHTALTDGIIIDGLVAIIFKWVLLFRYQGNPPLE